MILPVELRFEIYRRLLHSLCKHCGFRIAAIIRNVSHSPEDLSISPNDMFRAFRGTNMLYDWEGSTGFHYHLYSWRLNLATSNGGEAESFVSILRICHNIREEVLALVLTFTLIYEIPEATHYYRTNGKPEIVGAAMLGNPYS